VWSDEFNGDKVDESKWNLVNGGGGFGNGELQHYLQHNAHVSGGVLRITAKCEWFAFEHFTSAKLTTLDLAEWGPGHKVDVRARLPRGRGTWPAIWMLPSKSTFGHWPSSGEIDIMEAVGCNPNRVYGTVHTGAYNHVLHTERTNVSHTAVGEWHTYSIEWEDRRIRWMLDGRVYHEFSPVLFEPATWPFSEKFYLILNLAVGGSWGGHCLQGRHARPSCRSHEEFGRDQVMEVDFARVYRMN